MTGRSGRGRWERVPEARRQARDALGREPIGGDVYSAPPKRRTSPPTPPKPVLVASDRSTREYVLTLGSAATRLAVSRVELEAMIEKGKVEALQGAFIRVIPTREVERLQRSRSLET